MRVIYLIRKGATNWAKIADNSFATIEAMDAEKQKLLQEQNHGVLDKATPGNKESACRADVHSEYKNSATPYQNKQKVLVKEYAEDRELPVSFNKMRLAGVPVFREYTASGSGIRNSVVRKSCKTPTATLEATNMEIADNFGYDPKNYIRTTSGRVISNYVDIINNEVDYDELFAKVVYKPIEDRCKRATELFKSLSSGFVFENFEQVSKSDNKNYVDILQSAAWTEHLSGDTLLYYMITGKVA